MKATSVDFESFVGQLASDFGWDPNSLGLESTLVTDCGLDSLGMYELLLVLEDLGYEVDEDSLLEWVTLGDAFNSVMRTASHNTS